MYSVVRILIHQPVTQRLFEDFFIKRLEKEGIDVKFYDLTEVFHKNLKIVGEVKSSKVVKFDKIEGLRSQIIKDDKHKTLYIPYFIYEYKVLEVYKIFSKFNCNIAFMGRGMLPFPNVNKSLFSILVKNFPSFFDLGFLKRGIGKLYATFLKKKGYVKKFDVIFNAGYMGHYTCGTGFEMNSAKLIPFNSTDYTRYLRSLNSKFSISKPQYAVFLDEYLPFHPDVEMAGMKTVHPESYFKELNTFFSKIEDSLQMEVVIAAHPKSNYNKNPYDGRILIKGETENLIKNSALVIDHFSTAISYAILNEKPLFIFYTEEMNIVFPNLIKYAHHVSSILDVEIANITKEKQINFSLKINKEKYSEYKYNYLTMPEAEFLADEDLFMDFLMNSNNS